MAGQPSDLLSLLAAAERDMAAEQAPSEYTVDSEERDQLLLSRQIEDDLERKSQTSLSTRHRRSRRTGHRSRTYDAAGDVTRARQGLGSNMSSGSRSPSVLSTQQLHQLQQQLYKSGGSSGSSDAPSTEELWKLLQLSNQHMVALRQSEAAAAARHRKELTRLQTQLDLMREQELQAEKEKVQAEAKMSIDEAAQQVEIEIIRKKLHTSRISKNHQEEDLQEKAEVLEEVEQHAEQKVEMLRQELEAKKLAQKEYDEALRQSNAEEKSNMKSEISVLAAQLEKSKKELKMAVDERDVLTRNVVLRAGVERKVNNLQQVLQVANKELERVEDVAAAGHAPQDATPDFAIVHELLSQSKETEEQMEQEMSALRAQWWQEKKLLESAAEKLESGADKRGHRASVVGTGSSDVLATSGGSSSSSRSSGGRPSSIASLQPEPKAARGKGVVPSKLTWAGRLMAIAEEEPSDLISGDGSVAAAADGVGYSSEAPAARSAVADLADFDMAEAFHDVTPAAAAAAVKVKEKILKEKVDTLHRKKEETKRYKEELKAEMAEKEAALGAKVQELRCKLEAVKAEAVEKEEVAMELQQVVVKEEVKIEKVVEEVKVEIEVAEKKKELKEEHIEVLFQEVTERGFQNEEDKALWLQLLREFEELNDAAQVAEAEAEEQKAVMDSTRAEQESAVLELKGQLAELRRAQGIEVEEPDENEDASPPATSDLPVGEREHLQREIVALTEEHNMLINTLEWKDVQWRNVIEELEQEIAAERFTLQAQHDAEFKELQERLEEQAESLRLRLRSR